MSTDCLDQLVLQWSADSKAHTTVYPTNLTAAGYTYTQNTTHDVAGPRANARRRKWRARLRWAADKLRLVHNYANSSTWLNNEATIAEALG